MAKLICRTIRLGVAAALLLAADAQASESPLPTLTADDILSIQQLTARYAHLVDRCVNGGSDYANLFSEDGTFGVTDQWDKDGTIWARGHLALARAGGGGPSGCRPSEPGMPGYGLHHIVTSEVVEPAPGGGATGRSVLITMGVDGTPSSIEWQGGYQDRYIKTAQGWRIQSRWHVWPNYKSSAQLAKHPLPASLSPPQTEKSARP